MSMKIFTLSALCVLVFGLMIALSGITDDPGLTERRTAPADLQEGDRLLASLWDPPQSAGTAYEEVRDWDGHTERSTAPASARPNTGGTADRPIRLVGLVFIVLWVFVSVKLLSAE